MLLLAGPARARPCVAVDGGPTHAPRTRGALDSEPASGGRPLRSHRRAGFELQMIDQVTGGMM